MASTESLGTCPFCEFTDADMYILLLHIETLHSEGESPFVVRENQEESQTGLLQDRPNSDETSSATKAEDGSDEEDYVTCPEAECGEAVLLSEIEIHMDMHLAEKMTADDEMENDDYDSRRHNRKVKTGHHNHGSFDTESSSSRHLTKSPPTVYSSNPRGWRTFLIGTGSSKTYVRPKERDNVGPERLGKAELGPYAYEDQMPSSLRRRLEVGGTVTVRNQISSNGTLQKIMSVSNESKGIIPVIAQLCEQDPTCQKVYLCHPAVRHIFRMNREGGFCGYRNIQMMISYILETESEGYKYLRKGMPNVLQLQNMIEDAWDKGFNSIGRIETGGIKGTRKYIGTSEAQALFLSLQIPCEARAYGRVSGIPSQGDARPYERLLSAIESYFTQNTISPTASNAINDTKLHDTLLPPIYLQHPGHSLTIIGIETLTTGKRNLLVLDPMFKASPAISKLIDKQQHSMSRHHIRPHPTSQIEQLLKPYRRGEGYLRRYGAYETLELSTLVYSQSS